MPWVPVSDVFDITFYSDNCSIEGSVVNFGPSEQGVSSYWELVINSTEALRVRVSASSYSAASNLSGSIYECAGIYGVMDDTYSEAWYPNTCAPYPAGNMPSNDPVDCFPDIEHSFAAGEYDHVIYYQPSRVTSDYLAADEQFQFLIEVFVDSEQLNAADDYDEVNIGESTTTPVLANDTIDDGDGERPVTLADLAGLPVIVREPEHGTVTVNSDGTITYTPNPGTEATEDSYEYEILPVGPACATVVEEYNSDAGRYEYSVTGLSDDFNLIEGGAIYLTDDSGEPTWYLRLYVDEAGVLYGNGYGYGTVPFGTTTEAFVLKETEGIPIVKCAVITLQERL